MSDPSASASQILLPQIAAAYQNDPRTALVKALLANGQANITASPTYSKGATLAKALTAGIGGIANAYMQSQYQGQNAAAQQTIQDATKAAAGTKQWVDPDTGQVAIPGKAGSIQDMISTLASNPTTAPQALQLQTSMATSQAAARAALTNALAEKGLGIGADGSVAQLPGYGKATSDIIGANEGAKANAGVPAAIATSLGGKGFVPDGAGGVALMPGYAGGVAGVAGATKGAEANATNASDLNYKPAIAGATAAATLPTDVFKDYVKPQTVRPGGAVVGPMGSLANVLANLPGGQGAGAPPVAPAGGGGLASALAGPPPAVPAPVGAAGSPSSPDALAALQGMPGANQQLPPVPPSLQAQLNAPGAPAVPTAPAPAPTAGTPPAGATQVGASVTPVPHAPAGPTILASNDGGAMNAAKTNEDLYKEYQNYATNNPTLAQNLRNAAETFKYFQSGQSAPMQAQAAAWAKAAGIDPDKINLADPAQVQIAQKAATQALFSQMAGAKNPALGEYNMLQSAVAGPALQPEAAKSIIANSLAKVAYQNDHFQEMSNYRQQNGSMSGYDPSPFIIGAGGKMPKYLDRAMQSLPAFKGETVLPQHAAVPAPALSYLKTNDSPATRAAFDLKYGHGAAATALGGQ